MDMGKKLLSAGFLVQAFFWSGMAWSGAKEVKIDMDWRTDKAAYRSAKELPLPVVRMGESLQSKEFPIDPSDLRHKLMEFSGTIPVVVEGTGQRISERGTVRGRRLARAFLGQEYKALGFKVSEHNYGRGINFIAEKTGSDPSRVLILTSHYDSVRNAGANDNGSGTIAVLAIAKALAKYSFKYTLRVVSFDEEELGLIGSRYYAGTLSDRNSIIGNIQLDMVGTNSRGDGAFHVMDCDRSDSDFLSKSVLKEVVSLNLPLKHVSACTDRSDHASFWDKDIPAILISENFFGGDEDSCYHSACDIVNSRINFQYQANIAKAIASAVSQLLVMQNG